jgi:carboxypeptidase family protein/TonB-dependent receptor-like protein
MRRSVLVVACLVAVLAASGTAFAQRTTGTIVGTVTDDTGAVLPGVNVVLRGEAIMGTQDNVTNTEGFYRFAALPPGTYTLTFTMANFSTLNREGVRVNVGSTVEENVSLKLGQARGEEITVVGEGAVVDTQTNQVSTNYDKDWVRNAPVPRFTFFDLINAAPGVNASATGSSRSTSLGSGTTDNAYMLDGTDFTAPLTGAAWPWPNTDAIEEIEVLSLGATAEYGNVLGAVFNVVTRQGSNAFHGDANLYFQSQGLTSRNTTDEQDDGLPYNRDKYNDATFQLSGPILKDRLWFFGSYQYQRDYQSFAGTPKEFPEKFEADRVFGKLNLQINSKNRLMFAYHDDYYEIPGDTTAATAPSSVTVETGHNPSPNVTWTSVLSDKTYFEARYSGFYGKDHGDPLQDGEPRVKPRYYDLDTGEITGGIYSFYDGVSEKTAFSGKLSHFADKFMGASHDFKFGVQYNSGGSDYVLGPNDYIYTYGTEPAYGYTQLPYHQGGRMRNFGLFVDDTIRVGSRLSVNVGVRYDYSKAYFPEFGILDREGNETGQFTDPVDEVFHWNTVSPRIGFNWKLDAEGKTVWKAHYGRYYRGIVTGEFDNTSPSITPRYLFSGTYDARGNPEGLEFVSDNSNLRVDPNFDPPYTDQVTVGIERELVKNLGLMVHYVHKRGERYGGYRDIGGQYVPTSFVDSEGAGATGATIPLQAYVGGDRVFQLTNPDGMFSRFNGVTVQLVKRMADNWQLTTSFVWGRSTGRVGSSRPNTGAGFGPAGNQTTTAGRFGQNPNDFVNTDGRLIADRPVTFKTQLVYQFPAGFLAGANFIYQSGRPWARLLRVGDIVGIPTTIYAERNDGSRTVSDQYVLDLRLQKDFSLGGGAHFAVFADVLNALNDDAYEDIQDRVGTSENFALGTEYITPRRVMIGAKLRF